MLPTHTYSMAKTVTSFAIGMLIGDGVLSLDDKLCDLLSDELPRIVNPRIRRITVRHLLEMKSGVTAVSEAAASLCERWSYAYLTSLPTFNPGTKFHYNSMNSYMLAYILVKKTGKSLSDFLRERLFRPLGITNFFWECSPEGVEKGGWGLYLSPYDMGKLGHFLLEGGMADGVPLIPHDYLAEALTPHAHLSAQYGDYDYGYHLWVSRSHEAYLFNGMLGQNIWVCPKHAMVVVFTAGNEEFYQQSTTLATVSSYFGQTYEPSVTPLPPAPDAVSSLRRASDSFFRCRSMTGDPGIPCDDLFTARERTAHDTVAEDGILAPFFGTYHVGKNNVGILPLTLCLIQNTYAGGISRVRLSVRDGALVLSVTEGAVTRDIPCGLGHYLYTELDYLGDKYIVAASFAARVQADGRPALMIEIHFPELPDSRLLIIERAPEGLRIAFSSQPGVNFPASLLNSIITNYPKNPLLIKHLGKTLSLSAVRRLIEANLAPVLYARDASLPGKAKRPLRAKGKASALSEKKK